MLYLLAKLYLRALNLFTMSDQKVIFIIIIIILNLYDSSLSEFDCNIKPEALNIDLAAKSCYKNVIIKKYILYNEIKK